MNDLIEEIIENNSRREDSFNIIQRGNVRKNVIADRARIGQVLDNLISNAIKYSPKSKKVIVSVSASNGYLKFSVQDFGDGISKENLKKVFEPFFRESDMQRETFPSIGLGLYISAEIVKHYKGKIWVKSIAGKGTTFFVSLPLKSRKN